MTGDSLPPVIQGNEKNRFMLVLDLSCMRKREKGNNFLKKSFVAGELGLLLFPALEKTAHPHLRKSSGCDVLRTEPGFSICSTLLH